MYGINDINDTYDINDTCKIYYLYDIYISDIYEFRRKKVIY